MAKLDEIAELLTEEINGFEKSIGRLEKLHENLQNLPLRPDTTEVNTLLRDFSNNQKTNIEQQQRLMQRILHKVEKSILLPGWTIKMFWGLLFCVLLVFGFSIYQISRITKKEEAAYIKGQNSTMEHFGTFLDENPEAKDLYHEWTHLKGKK